MKYKNIFANTIILMCSIGFIFVECIQNYFVKSAIKLIIGVVIPFITCWLFRNDSFKKFLKFKKSEIRLAECIGIIIFVIIIGGFFCFRQVIDYSGVIDSMFQISNGSIINLLLIDANIVFINSFIEELFFRGFLANTFKNKKIAYFISSLMFALYHSFMLINWFDIVIYTGILFGLFIIGMVFIKLNEKSENIYSSWIVHMFCNFALNVVGLILFIS